MRMALIKIGGRVAADKDLLKKLASEMASMKKINFFFVHGGGAEVTKISEVFGLKPVFENGKRKTTPEEMDIVDMVLGGKMNKYIVRLFSSFGLNPVGLCGADGKIFTGKKIEPDSRTGEITDTNPDLLLRLSTQGYLPVISSVSMDADCTALNINADDAALAVAKSLPVNDLIFISDIAGILKDNEVIKELSPAQIDEEIKHGVISGGMIPKVESSVKALESGVKSVIIGGYTKEGDLSRLLHGETGTRIREV